MIRLLPLLFWFLCTHVAQTNEPHKAIVSGIVDGDTVFITPPFKVENEIRLVGIQAPKLPLGWKNFLIWALACPFKCAKQRQYGNLDSGRTASAWVSARLQLPGQQITCFGNASSLT